MGLLHSSQESNRQAVAAVEAKTALAKQHYETARRLCLDALQDSSVCSSERNELLIPLHSAYRALGDLRSALRVLDQIEPRDDKERAEVLLLRAEDFGFLMDDGFYRESEEKRHGLSLDEYIEKIQAAAIEPLEAAVALGLNGHSSRAAKLFQKLGLDNRAQNKSKSVASDKTNHSHAVEATQTGTVSGKLCFPDRSPVIDATVTLGLVVDVEEADPATYLQTEMGYSPRIGEQRALRRRTDGSGYFCFDEVPVGKHEFLAATLDGNKFDIQTRFFAHGVKVLSGEQTCCDAVLEEWSSAPPRCVDNPFPETIERDGVVLRRIHTEVWQNPFYYDFPRQLIAWPLPEQASRNSHRLLLLDATAPGRPVRFQISGEHLLFFSSLGARSDRVLALYECDSDLVEDEGPQTSRLQLVEDGKTLVVDTGRAQFRFPAEAGESTLPPLIEVRGEDEKWRGSGRWSLPPEVVIESRRTHVIEAGPLQVQLTVEYTLSSGDNWTFRFTAHEEEAYLLVHECAPPIDGAAFEFSLREFAEPPHGGRGFLHWTPEHGNRHWSTLRAEDCELARLQESVAWWVPPCGFGYAFTPDGLDQKDYVGVFTIRRGEWTDPQFEKLTHGPRDADGTPNPELDWPFPEMIGSTISMITAHTDKTGDAFFRWGAFGGERHWGILVSTLERNEGPHKEISLVQHKNSSPRLQDFRRWHLDEADSAPRPHLLAQKHELTALRRKRTTEAFAPYWAALNRQLQNDQNGSSTAGFVFAVEGDPLIAWRKKRELVSIAHIRSRMTLLGRDYSDMYSPVGARPITNLAETYDLIAASGVFTPEEERLVRSFLMLMGHMYLSPDLMNWHYGSRNANFEADRVDVVGVIGLCFPGNPDAKAFVDHAVQLMERSLDVYCTPGSGKWYENPACYYLQASKCRANLAFHLWRHGIYDATQSPRFKEFLRWGVLLLTPPLPAYDMLRDGCSEQEYSESFKRRVLPPLGDHAGLGRFVPEHYAFCSLMYREHDPEFAAELMWAYQQGSKAGYYFGNVPVLFAALQEGDLEPVTARALKSQRLAGFGAVLRDNFGSKDEQYVLWKQGPGGYRYQRSEGSFMLFAGGVPLVYEGGEAGETWRHSTLSFGDVHMPLASGRVERFHSRDGIDFVQGVHPKVLSPGEPIYLSDDCHHNLVEEAYRRYATVDPAVIRSLWRVRDEYIVIHDDLQIPEDLLTHWHLHAVADAEEYSEEYGFIFKGRFGVNLQVLLPGQSCRSMTINDLPLHEYYRPTQNRFTTRHLCVTAIAPNFCLALLRPLFGDRKPLRANFQEENRLPSGVHVQGEKIDDHLFFAREKRRIVLDGATHVARYAAVLRHGDDPRVLHLDAPAH